MGCLCSNDDENDQFSQNHLVILNRNPGNSNSAHNPQNNNNTRSRRQNQRYGNSSDANDHHIRNIEPYLQSRSDQFFNFKEIDDKYCGEGLKKMKGYISPISKEDLIKKRIAFWETRIEGNQETWQFLRQICENPDFEHEDIREYLSATGITPYKNCINVTYDTFGGLYEIPNYCIHDPSKYDLPEEHKKKPPEAPLKIILRKGTDELPIKITNYTTIEIIKNAICDKFPNLKDKKVNKSKIMLFFGGKQLKDDKELWFYNVIDESIIQFMIRN